MADASPHLPSIPQPQAGTVLVHRATGTVIVAADHLDGSPPDGRHLCWAVVTGHASVGAHRPWLTGYEVDRIGGWRRAGNLVAELRAASAA